MKDSSNKQITVIGSKEFTQIFAVCGFNVHEKISPEIMDKSALVINTQQTLDETATPYPIVLEVKKWKE